MLLSLKCYHVNIPIAMHQYQHLNMCTIVMTIIHQSLTCVVAYVLNQTQLLAVPFLSKRQDVPVTYKLVYLHTLYI